MQRGGSIAVSHIYKPSKSPLTHKKFKEKSKESVNFQKNRFNRQKDEFLQAFTMNQK